MHIAYYKQLIDLIFDDYSISSLVSALCRSVFQPLPQRRVNTYSGSYRFSDSYLPGLKLKGAFAFSLDAPLSFVP